VAKQDVKEGPTSTPTNGGVAVRESRPLDFNAPITREVQVVRMNGSHGQLLRMETTVTLPGALQYAVGYGDSRIVKPSAAGYMYLNRTVGMQWVDLPEVPYHGKLVPSPVIERDYVLIGMGSLYYSDLGQLLMDREIIEIDFQGVYMQALVGSDSYDVQATRDEDGWVEVDENGRPKMRYKVSNDDLRKAERTLANLRQFGLRKARSIAAGRLFARATGIMLLDRGKDAQIRHRSIRLIGWNDYMTPEERWESAQDAVKKMFGDEAKPVTVNTTDLAGTEDVEEALEGEFDADAVGREHGEEPPADEPQAESKPPSAGQKVQTAGQKAAKQELW